MKIIILSLILILTLASCSSGTSVADIPSSVTASTFIGTYSTANGLGSGDIVLDLTDDGAGSISGNLIVSERVADSCLCSSTVTGTQIGFDVQLTTGDCTVTQRPLTCDSPIEVTEDVMNADGTITEVVVDTFCAEEDFTGSGNIALTGTLNSFSGTFVMDGNICSAPVFSSINNDRTGTISVSR